MPISATHIIVVPDNAALNRKAAQEFYRCAHEAVRDHEKFCVALSGGSTPRSVYALLAEDHKSGAAQLNWDRIFIFFGDERHVPPDHPDSNYRMAFEALLSQVPIPAENIFRVKAELPAEDAAAQYETSMRGFFQLKAGEWPRFDLVFLGLGEDGHTASLFPGSKALLEDSRLVAANWVEKFSAWRITMTYPVLNHAAEAAFLVSGLNKAEIIKKVFDKDSQQDYPARKVKPEGGRLLWIMDENAACLL